MEEKRQPSAANVAGRGQEPVWVFRGAATAADSPSGKAEPTRLGRYPIRRRQRRMRGNLPGPEGLARRGASAALHGLPVVTTRGGAARLASAPSALSNGVGQAQLHRTDIRPCQRGSREILRQAPSMDFSAAALLGVLETHTPMAATGFLVALS